MNDKLNVQKLLLLDNKIKILEENIKKNAYMGDEYILLVKKLINTFYKTLETNKKKNINDLVNNIEYNSKVEEVKVDVEVNVKVDVEVDVKVINSVFYNDYLLLLYFLFFLKPLIAL